MYLGSSRVILSRSFVKCLDEGRNPVDEISAIRNYLARDDVDFSFSRKKLGLIVDEIVRAKRAGLGLI